MTETPLEPGMFYPRIARPYSHEAADSPGWNPEDEEKAIENDTTLILAENAGQLHLLKEHLEEICRVVYPCQGNVGAFGHEIRNVFIAACTEVEAQWRGVLKANGYTFSQNKDGDDLATRSDYRKLLEPLRLYEYCVRFPYFPTLEPIWPFKEWKESGKLPWYNAYNQTKHDREKNFNQAKLIYAFEAAAAYFVMLCAQHGWEVAARPAQAKSKFFFLKSAPTWEQDYCYKPFTNGNERKFTKCKKFFVKDPSKAVKRRDLILAKSPKFDSAIMTP